MFPPTLPKTDLFFFSRMVLRCPGGWGLTLALVFVYLVGSVEPAPLDDWAHDDTQLSFPTEGRQKIGS